MPNYAKIVLIGHLGRAPELKTVGSKGTSLADVSLAVSTGWGDNKETSWWRLSIWGKTAEWAAANLQKGDPVFVEGEPKLREWADRDGGKRISGEVFVQKIVRLKWDTPAADPYANDDTPPAHAAGPVDDDLPF